MILKTDEIANRLKLPKESDPFVIVPRPNLDDLGKAGAASLDLHLGRWFCSLRQARLDCLKVLTRKEDAISEARMTSMSYVPFGRDFYLHPGNFVLGVTLEWMRLPSDLAAYVVGRSSWGRRGLIIATATGVHPGFTGCLTLEITNIGEIPIAIRPGMSICQVFIHTVESKTDKVDLSRFVGLRKPTLGHISFEDDTFATRLSKGMKVEA